jgi:hypothetical protein
VGVSRSSASREAVQASAEQLKSLPEKRRAPSGFWRSRPLPAPLEPDIVDSLNGRIVIYFDGQRFGAHHIISAACGRKTETEIPQEKVA